MIKEIIALIATILVVSSYIPQVLKAYKTKSLSDISIVYLIAICFGVFLWIIYAVLNNDLTFFIANVIILMFASMLISMKIYYAHKNKNV